MIARLPPFLRFALVGALGFGVDLAVLWVALEPLQLGVYAARLVSFAVTVTFTWAMNRYLTFGNRRAHGPLPHRAAHPRMEHPVRLYPRAGGVLAR